MIDLRTYQPGTHVNDLGDCFDYAWDRGARDEASSLLREARTTAEILGNTTPPSGEGMAPIARLQMEHNLAEHRVLLLEGMFAQAQRAVESYPAEIVAKATERFGL